MTLHFYHILHLVGLICVFIGFGALLSSESARHAMKWHGIGLLISLISGFGMLAKLSKALPAGAASPYMSTWVMIKFALWLVLGFLPVLVKRKILSARVVILLAAFSGAALAYLGYFKDTAF
jgi:hypothetical protein